MYYFIHLDNERAYNSILRLMNDTDEEGQTILDEDKQVKTQMVSLFPFRWWRGHFTNSPRDYSFEDEDMDEQDKAS